MIGIFDSGVGGLTVVKELRRQLPGASFIYLGDNARTPYGNRSQDIIQKYSSDDVEFLIGKGAKVIVVACNTASALAGEYLKQKYDLPIFEVITPAAAAASQVAIGHVGVIGTRGTINSNAYGRQLQGLRPELLISSQACPLLVPLVEENLFNRAETKMILRSYLHPLKLKGVDTLILGCTHYPLLKKHIQIKVGGQVKLIDPAEEVIKSLGEYLLATKQNFGDGVAEFYATDPDSRFKEIGEVWLQEEIDLQRATL